MTQNVEEAGVILIGLLHVFFYAEYSILARLFELCPFMQTVLPHESQVKGFFLTHTQSPGIINSDTLMYFTLKRSCQECF